jgi:hypothetical protein
MHVLQLQVLAGEQRASVGERLLLSDGGRVRVQATVAAAAEMPESIAYASRGMQDQPRWLGDTVTLHGERSRKWIAGGERRVELVVNGRVAGQRVIPADGEEHELEFEVSVDRSSWLAIRSFPQLHTNPVEVLAGGRPIRASAESARWCQAVIRQLWRVREGNIAEGERAAALECFERAIAEYGRRAGECEP